MSGNGGQQIQATPSRGFNSQRVSHLTFTALLPCVYVLLSCATPHLLNHARMQIFITGTDTDAGKTYVTCRLLEAFKASGRVAVGCKPFCCGSREDVANLREAGADGFSLDELNPCWMKIPASPYASSLIENQSIEPDAVLAACVSLRSRAEHILMEGVGGWEVPITEKYTAADFAEHLGWPVVVVVNNKLGALNHTILTARNIQSRGLTCPGIILNYASAERDAASISNSMILDRMGIPVLGELMHGETDASELLRAMERVM
jgi:dethiobiotin synthetase